MNDRSAASLGHLTECGVAHSTQGCLCSASIETSSTGDPQQYLSAVARFPCASPRLRLTSTDAPGLLDRRVRQAIRAGARAEQLNPRGCQCGRLVLASPV